MDSKECRYHVIDGDDRSCTKSTYCENGRNHAVIIPLRTHNVYPNLLSLQTAPTAPI